MLFFMFEKEDHVNFTENQKGYGPQRRNFISSRDTTAHRHENFEGMSRYDVSPVAENLIQASLINSTKFKNVRLTDIAACTISEKPNLKNYIISVGVNHSPDDWTGPPITTKKFGKGRKSLFEDLHPKYLKDLQNDEAFLLIDQTHEGYTNRDLWAWFYTNLDIHSINPNRIIYITGDCNCKKAHLQYCGLKSIPEDKRMFVQSFSGFQWMIYVDNVIRITVPYKTFDGNTIKLDHTVESYLNYKKNNLENIKVYNCLQKRERPHRCWFYKELLDNNLLKSGIVSTNLPPNRFAFEFEGRAELSEEEYLRVTKHLPLLHEFMSPDEKEDFTSGHGGSYISEINPEVMLHSFVSIISEASFGDNSGQGQCFLSEKTFKPIAQLHPFIILGDRNSLKNLKDLGYKTFDRWWDESYDTLPNWERMDAILCIMKKLENLSKDELLHMYSEMEEVLTHNYNTLVKNCRDDYPQPVVNIIEYVRGKLGYDITPHN